MKPPQGFTYYGVNVSPLRPNNSGLRYEAYTPPHPHNETDHLRADTKEGIKELIRHNLPKHQLRKSRA
jgi:hypothetical protein